MPFSTGLFATPGRLVRDASLIAACCAALVAGCSKKNTETGGDGSIVVDLAGTDGGGVLPDLLPAGDMAQAPCGNGAIDTGETCDDSNDVDGDGCSSTCQVEIGWQCPTVGAPCVRQVYCGDGYVEAPETCDDGNSTPGDGCSGTCQLEPNYVCASPPPALNPPHEVCTSTIICGDGKIEPGESCDTGTTPQGPGCAVDCSMVTMGYTCAPTGGPCVVAISPCGNGTIDPGESCDDGNTGSGDGCSSTCKIEPGYTCPKPDTMCQLIPKCGDGHLDLTNGEQCDDHNTTSGDGCSSTCQVESDYHCTQNSPSVCSKYVCGDGIINGTDQCDDGNNTDGNPTGTPPVPLDGCSATCQLDTGWTCPNVDSPCVAKQCGDGTRAGSEACDLGANNGKGLGCSSTCTVTTGYACTTNAAGGAGACHTTTCGDNKVEGYEQCDDGNTIPYDGCSPTCTNEPTCANGSCTGACGDGLKFPSEQCDDGNTISGDGCSSKCLIEPGFTCTQPAQTSFPSSFTVPILYRDMIHENNGTNGVGGVGPPAGTTPNPDFDNYQITSKNPGVVTGLVNATLGTDSEPVFLSAKGNFTSPVLLPSDATSTTPGTGTDQGTVFYWWYHEKQGTTPNPYDKLVYKAADGTPTTLLLQTAATTPNANSVYKFSSQSFFPLDGLGWNATAATTQVDKGGTDNANHNFSFTSELHYIFTYSSAAAASATPPTFTFNGDDDVWAFINGHLVADIGGIHGPEGTDFTYPLNTTNGTALGLVDKGWYSIDVFQAERHVSGSTYNLTLQSFQHVTSVCAPICGDGVIEAGEACDNGSTDSSTGKACTSPGTPTTCKSNNTSGTAYDGCSADCKTRGPYCGDKITETSPPPAAEKCDDGSNLTDYTTSSSPAGACAPMCLLPAKCGDGTRQAVYGEDCDDGASNGKTGDKCTAMCTLLAYCGDGSVNNGEQCDDGVNNGVSGDKCSSTCTFLCGNGKVDPGEACDNGTANNTGGYDGCSASCTLGGFCGDGIKNGPEQCDNGTNDGSYGTCTSTCMLAAYCGDGVVNGNEMCDQGSANSQNAYGPNKCTTSCQTAPYCGDGIVESSFGEKCDGGSSCNSMCMQTIQ